MRACQQPLQAGDGSKQRNQRGHGLHQVKIELAKAGAEARHEVRTHGAPAKLLLEASAEALASPGDVCLLRATLLDAEGAPVLTRRHEVTFAASGSLRMRGVGGKPQASTIFGLARVAVSAESVGEGAVEATCGAIRSQPVRLRVG